MPHDDENRSGRLKDHLSVLMDIANGYLTNIIARTKMAKQCKVLKEKSLLYLILKYLRPVKK